MKTTTTNIQISKLIKRSLITSLVSVALCPAMAQPTFTSVDVPVAKPQDTILQYVFSGNGLTSAGTDAKGGLSGANRTWNYSTLSLNQPKPVKTVYLTPASTPYFGSFPTAQLAYMDIVPLATTATIHTYIRSTSTDVKELGFRSSVAQNPSFSNATLMKFPFSMNSIFSDAVHFISPQVKFHEYKTIKADGYGTLVLPNATYTNVLRVRTVTLHKDTTPFGIGNQIDTAYAWYAKGDAVTPLFKIIKKVGNNFVGQPVNSVEAIVFFRKVAGRPPYRPPVRGSYGKQDEGDLTQENQIAPKLEFNLFPNPTSGVLTIKSNFGEVPENTKFTVRNALGQVVIQDNLAVSSDLEVNTQLDMFNLDNGLYFFEVFINEERIIKKIVKQ